MKNFSISTNIYFGSGSLDSLSELVDKKVCIICDKFISTCGIAEEVSKKLDKCEVLIFDEIVPDPTIEIVASGVQLLNNFKVDIIIGLGGGSSIDGAKAIKDYYKKLNKINNKIEFYAIPTTSGTGSEVTEYAVITNKQESLKYALADKSLLPTVAILDASLVKSVPKSITADTGMDVITHAIEAYISTESTDFTDAMAEKSFKLAMKYLLKAYENGGNMEAREKMHNASCLAGIAFNSAGLGITHSLAHAIGGKLHIPHGKINAIILPYVIEFNANINRDLYVKDYSESSKRYQELAISIKLNGNTPIIAVNNLIKHIFQLQKKLLIPSTLKELKVDINLLETLKDEIFSAVEKDICTKTNPRNITREDFEILLKKIIG